jgi:hypothetical protein
MDTRQTSESSHGSRSKKIGASAHEMAPLENEDSMTRAPRVLDEVQDYEYTAYAFSNKKKWAILTVVALCQTSMSKFWLRRCWVVSLMYGRLQCCRVLQCHRPAQQALQSWRQHLHKCQDRHGLVLDPLWYWVRTVGALV